MKYIGFFLSLCLAIAAAPVSGQDGPEKQTNALLIGAVEELVLHDPGDTWSSGTLVVGGTSVIIPRNLLIDLPANRLSLQQLFAGAPAACVSAGESGLAAADTCASSAGTVAILANQLHREGRPVAADVFLEKGQETATGQVTYIDHTDGYLEINGKRTVQGTGTMVRINDPSARFTVQQGLGCAAGSSNCSADERYGVDSDNYTITYSTGYPACLASTVVGGNRTVGSDAAGVGDPLCPDTNRSVNNGRPVVDSTRFAPIELNDHVTAEGNLETIGGVTFLSAHTLTVSVALTTAPGQPDYMIFDEAEWDVAGFQNERVRALFIGFATLGDTQLDIFALHVDPATNANNEVPIASTVNNPDTIDQGVPPTESGVFKVTYDVDFIEGAPVDVDASPCVNLNNAGFATCTPFRTLDEEFRVLSPISREIIGRTRHSQTITATVLDTSGNPAPFGEYLTPVGIGHPEFGEIDLNRLQTPFVFTGEPWNMDRRLGPGGCDGPCEGTPQPLDPFPFSGFDPRTQAQVPLGTADRILSFWPFGATDVLAWPPTTDDRINLNNVRWKSNPTKQRIRVKGKVTTTGSNALPATVEIYAPGNVDATGSGCVGTLVAIQAVDPGTRVFNLLTPKLTFPANPGTACVVSPNAGAQECPFLDDPN